MDAPFAIAPLPPTPPLSPVSPGTAPATNPEPAANPAQAAAPQPQTPVVPANDAMLVALKELAASEAAMAQSVNATLQAAAANQGGLAPLMADLVQAQQASGLPASVQAAIVQVLALRSPLDPQVSGADIKAALTKSGLFSEPSATADLRTSPTTTAAPQALPAGADIKTALLVLQQVLKTWIAGTPTQPPAPVGGKNAAPEPPRSPANNPPPPFYRGGPTGSVPPPLAPASAAAVLPAMSPDAAAKPAQAASIPPQAQIVPPPQAAPGTPLQLLTATPVPGVMQPAAAAPGSPILPAGAEVKTALPVPPPLPLMKTALVDAVPQPYALASRKDAAPSPSRAPADNSPPSPYRAPTSAQPGPAPASPAPVLPAMSPEVAAKAALPASLQPQAQIAPASQATTQTPQPLLAAEETASMPQPAATTAGAPPAGTDMKVALLVIQQLLKTSLAGDPAQLSLETGKDAASETPRPPTPANSPPPPPYRGGPTSAQPTLPSTLSADATPRLVGQVLLSHTEAALSHMKLLQIASLPDTPQGIPQNEDQGSRWMFEIPFATPQGSAVAQFEISRDGGGDAEAQSGPVWRAWFSLDIEPMGPVHAQVALMGERAWVTLWAEREASVQTLRAKEALLSQALKDSDFVAEVAFCLGAPHRRVAAAGQFLDSAS